MRHGGTMCELGIKTRNLQEESPDNTQESELTIFLWQDTKQNSKSHLVLLYFCFLG